MGGLGKKRTKLGKFIDSHSEINQEWLVKKTKLSRDGISDLCDSEKSVKPRINTKQKIVSVLRAHGYNVRMDDFW